MSYIPHRKEDRERMLAALGLNSLEELFLHVPSSLRCGLSQRLAEPLAEREILNEIQRYAHQNFQGQSFVGFGLYDHYVPAVVNHLANLRPFVTSYTPYQAEVAQGTLQALFEFQSLMVLLTDMEIANASLYDGATAMVEAVRMALRMRGSLSETKIVISEGIHPYYRETLKTYFPSQLCELLNVTFVYLPVGEDGETRWQLAQGGDIFVFQNPNFWGVEEKGAIIIKQNFPQAQVLYGTNEPHSLTVLDSPRHWGAHVVWGEAQSLGLPTMFGGPSLGFLAARREYLRQMPGRLIGQTSAKTALGEPCEAYVITLSTREQHIRREKATSNICSNQTLMAIRSAIYMAYHGWDGLQTIYRRCVYLAKKFAQKLWEINPKLLLWKPEKSLHEVLWKTPRRKAIFEAAIREGIYPGYPLEDDKVLSYFPEYTHEDDLEKLLTIIAYFEASDTKKP